MSKRGAQLRRRALDAGFEAIRRPGLLSLKLLRAIPGVRTRVIPALLKEELDQIPSAATAEGLKRELERLQRTDAPAEGSVR